MRLLVLQHIACEHPGVFSEVMRERGVEAVPVELDEGEPLPDWREFDAVLAMGGPMGAGDDADHPWLAAEKELVREAVEDGRPFLGVCLGVQLLAAALGARGVRGRARRRSACSPVELTAEGRDDPLFAGLDDRLVSLQWHGDTFELPAGRGAPGALAGCVPTRPSGPASAPTGSSSTSRSPPRWRGSGARSRPTASRWRDARGGDGARSSSPRSSGARDELHPPARRLFENWLELAERRRSDRL